MHNGNLGKGHNDGNHRNRCSFDKHDKRGNQKLRTTLVNISL